MDYIALSRVNEATGIPACSAALTNATPARWAEVCRDDSGDRVAIRALLG